MTNWRQQRYNQVQEGLGEDTRQEEMGSQQWKQVGESEVVQITVNRRVKNGRWKTWCQRQKEKKKKTYLFVES